MTTDSADVVLADEHWRVTVAPSFGFLIRDALDLGSGAPMLWRQPAQAAPPLPLSLPPGGPESIETFWEVFAGGWFPMFPTAGFTGELDGAQTLFHGELNRLPWQVLDRGPAWIEAGLRTLRAPFAVIRRVSLEGGEMRVETEVSNAGQTPASFTYGEHPCFLHATFAGGKLELDAAEAWVPDPPFDPERVKLRTGERFTWPQAPCSHESLDLSILPSEVDGRHDHVCVRLASPLVRIGAPRYVRTLEIEVDLAATPCALLWQDFGERGVFAIEPGTAPGRGIEDALAAGAVGRLQPGERFCASVALRWSRGEG